MHIHSLPIDPSGPAEIPGEVADPCKTRKTPVQRVFQCSLIRSDAADAAAADEKCAARRRRRRS